MSPPQAPPEANARRRRKKIEPFHVNLRTRDHKMTRQEHCQLSLASASDEAHEKDFLGIATIILPMCVM